MPHYPNDVFFFSFIILCVIALFTSYYAQTKGRNPAVWFFLTLLFGFFAPLFLFFLPTVEDEENGVKKKGFPSSENIQITHPTSLPPSLFLESKSSDRCWYYLDARHHQQEPISFQEMKAMWKKNELTSNDYIWTFGMETWQKICWIDKLEEKLSSD